MDQKKLKDVFTNEMFVDSLLAMQTSEEVQAALKEKGIETSIDEILQLRDKINRSVEAKRNGDEFNLEQLDDVAGGIVFELIGAGLFIAFVLTGVSW